jgi:hypothetical protein
LFTGDLANLADPNTGISFKVKSVDKPKVDLMAQELNQYNRKRIVYTKVEYHAITMRLHDTTDDRPLRTWIDYFTYYFGDSRKKNALAYSQNVTNPTLYDSSGWGFRPVEENKNFFERIELYTMFGGHYTQLNYINPKITALDGGSYDQTSSDLEEMSLTFRYEALEYVNSNAPITQEMATMFGFMVDPATVEVAGAPNFGQGSLQGNSGSLEAMQGFLSQVSPVTSYSLQSSAMGLFGIAGGLDVGGFVTDTISGTVGSVFSAVGNIGESVIGGAIGAVGSIFGGNNGIPSAGELDALNTQAQNNLAGGAVI